MPRYQCITKCFKKGQLFEVGDVVDSSEKFPKHFVEVSVETLKPTKAELTKEQLKEQYGQYKLSELKDIATMKQIKFADNASKADMIELLISK